MSWMGKKPGKPKEEGGHERVNISIDQRLFKILEVPDNCSKYVEYCVNECTETKWVAFHESNVTVSDYYSRPKTATTFFLFPNDAKHNAIVATFCAFQYQCTGKGFRFRMRINETVTPFIEVPGSSSWSPSQVYTDSSFVDGIEVACNQNGYVIEFQFEPQRSSDCASVKDIYMFFEVVDGLPTLEH